MCSIKGAAPTTADGRFEAASTLNPAVSNNPSASDPVPSPAEPMILNVEDMEAFQLFSSEIFDPSIFEGFHQSPVEGIALGNGLWEESPRGGL
ncbi:hypothetical protein AbraIFM66950_002032 [Aspergillus brasiliensis]|nr:hypothetical protein AbraIFM66950_002032 [Aspergillus brasiliensis]